jgi:hypothetical protein
MTDTRSLVEGYLDRLDRTLRDVPAARRKEIVAEIRDHIDEATSGSIADADEAEVRTILDQLGDPETIAEEARDRFDVPKRRAGWVEGLALAFLLIGGFIGPGLGWLVGVILLWVSSVWTIKDKIIGTAFVPGGLAGVFFMAAFAMSAFSSSSSSCTPGARGITQCTEAVGGTNPLGYIVMAFLVIAPIASAIYLGRRAFRQG